MRNSRMDFVWCGCGPIPLVSKEGWPRSGRVVSKRSRSLLILLEFTNHPVCAAKEGDLLIEAQPPLLEKEGIGLGVIHSPRCILAGILEEASNASH